MTDCVGAIDDVAEGAGEGADSIVLVVKGAIGCGCAKVVDEAGAVRGGDASAANGFVLVCCGAGDVADWKSSKSSSPAAPNLGVAVPFNGCEIGAGSSSKLNKSFSGSFFLAGAAACDALVARLALLVVAVVLLGAGASSSSPASYSSKSSPRRCVL